MQWDPVGLCVRGPPPPPPFARAQHANSRLSHFTHARAQPQTDRGQRLVNGQLGAPCAVKITKCKKEEDRYGRWGWVDRYNSEHHHLLLEEVHVHRKATALGHPAICSLQGAFETKLELSELVQTGLEPPGFRRRLTLVLDYYPGYDLHHVLQRSETLPGVMPPEQGMQPQRRPFNEVDKRNMFTPVVQAVAELHRAGIVHRDIKPDNIVMKAVPLAGESPALALIDFGLYVLLRDAAAPARAPAAEKKLSCAYTLPRTPFL